MTDLLRNLLVSSDPVIFDINQSIIKHKHNKLRPEVIQLLGDDTDRDADDLTTTGRNAVFGDYSDFGDLSDSSSSDNTDGDSDD